MRLNFLAQCKIKHILRARIFKSAAHREKKKNT